MKGKLVFCVAIISAAVAFTACASDKGSAPASAEVLEPAAAIVASGAEERLSPGLFPAYIIDGPNKKWGYINKKGEFVIKPQYENAMNFQGNGMAGVSDGEGWKLIDLTGKPVISSRYLGMHEFSGKLVVVNDESGRSSLYDEKGQVLFQTEGSIEKLSCGMAAFSKSAGNYRSLWGYINSEGKVIVEAQYEWAQSFSKDKALVKISEGSFGIIDKEGKLLREIKTNAAKSLSEDVFVFSKTNGGKQEKFGYMTTEGEVLLDAAYAEAAEFVDGLAIVGMEKEYEHKYGVINRKGEFVIPAEYTEIKRLGNGIFAVPESSESWYHTDFLKKALFDRSGKQLTDFSYYYAEELENGLISVSDDKSTYLVDGKSDKVSSFPRIEGLGSIKLLGNIYKVEADNMLYYISLAGETIWASDNTTRFEGGLEVRMKTFRPDRCKLIQYPELEGLEDTKVLDGINAMLRDKFVGEGKGSNKNGELYTDSIEVGFNAEKNKDLLIISRNGYYYPIGAAHGQPYREEYHINIKTGKLFSMKDLFKAGSGYETRLSEIVRKKIARANEELGERLYGDEIGELGTDNGYTFRKDALQIYFYPYAIAAYAMGFPEFDIGYAELGGLIDTEGELWNSFDRVLPGKKDKASEKSYSVDKDKIEEAVKGYETAMVEAINRNDFRLVEPWLYPDSSLYASQKKLVGDLNKKQIKERLEGYTIADITTDSLGIIRAYVVEDIAIQYPGKEYTVKQFKWVYSARYSYDNKGYQLTYIDKWE